MHEHEFTPLSPEEQQELTYSNLISPGYMKGIGMPHIRFMRHKQNPNMILLKLTSGPIEGGPGVSLYVIAQMKAGRDQFWLSSAGFVSNNGRLNPQHYYQRPKPIRQVLSDREFMAPMLGIAAKKQGIDPMAPHHPYGMVAHRPDVNQKQLKPFQDISQGMVEKTIEPLNAAVLQAIALVAAETLAKNPEIKISWNALNEELKLEMPKDPITIKIKRDVARDIKTPGQAQAAAVASKADAKNQITSRALEIKAGKREFRLPFAPSKENLKRVAQLILEEMADPEQLRKQKIRDRNQRRNDAWDVERT